MFLMKLTHKSVTQEDALGCGVACVAYILGLPYKQALLLFNNPEKAKTKGFTVKDLSLALNKESSVPYKTRYVGRTLHLNILDQTIVYVKKCDEFPFGHYLVKNSRGFMDPCINLTKAKEDISLAKSGFRKSFPGKIVLVVMPVEKDSRTGKASSSCL